MTCLTGSMGTPPDADEATDPLELVGFVAADMTTGHNADRVVPIEPLQCLGFMCPLRSDACDDCEIVKKANEALGDEDTIPGDAGNEDISFDDSADEHPIVFVERDDERFDYLCKVFPTPSMGRGKRAVATRLTACS